MLRRFLSLFVLLTMLGVGPVVVRADDAPAPAATPQVFVPLVLRSNTSDPPAPNPTSPAPNPTSPAPNPTPPSQQPFEVQVITLVNQERAKVNCPALVANNSLTIAARKHSQDMADNNYFSHTGRDGSTPGSRARNEGYPSNNVGENIAAGYATPEAVMQGWMGSSGHRANILNCSYRVIGVGYYQGGSMRHYWTQMFGSIQPANQPTAQPTTQPTTQPTQPTQPTAQPTQPVQPTAQPTTQPTQPPSPSNFEQQVIELVNQERAKAGCQPLTPNANLAQAAEGHSQDMANNNFVGHTGSNGSKFSDRITAAGYQWSSAGENVAGGQSTPAQVMQGWMNSSGHRANILNCGFKDIGVGYVFKADSNYRHYWTQVFGTSR